MSKIETAFLIFIIFVCVIIGSFLESPGYILEKQNLEPRYEIVEYSNGKCLITVTVGDDIKYLNSNRTVFASINERDTLLEDYRLIEPSDIYYIHDTYWSSSYELDSYKEAKQNLDKYLELKRGYEVLKVHQAN